MDPVTLNSSAIRSVQYNDEDGTITIVFTSGGAPVTKSCPKELYEEFISSASAGKFYHQRIKNL